MVINLDRLKTNKKEKTMERKEITISENKKRGTKMVVVHRVVDGKENRRGKPFIISETKHVK